MQARADHLEPVPNFWMQNLQDWTRIRSMADSDRTTAVTIYIPEPNSTKQRNRIG